MSTECATGYMREDIPAVEIPPYRGERYEDTVPDTLDIAERIELAVNGVTGPTDPDMDYRIYFWANFFHEPPVMTHDFSDWCQPKFMEALPLLRIASGSTLNHGVDEVWQTVLLKSIGPDGLFYLPLSGDSWYRINLHPTHPVFRADGGTVPVSDESVTRIAAPFACGRLISTMTIYYLRDRNPVWKDIIETMIGRLSELAIQREDYCFYPVGFFEPYAKIGGASGASPADNIVDYGGARLIEALSRYYRETGHEPAIDLAGKLVRAVRHHSFIFDKDGVFINRRAYTREGQAATGEAPGEVIEHGGHFHSHTIALLNLLEYAVVVRDQELIEFVRRSYEWARMQGSNLTGYFPTVIHPHHQAPDLPYSGIRSPWYDEFEICELADMIALALKLSEAGFGDYYDDVERWVRNYFAEGQLTRIDWISTRPRYMDTRPIFPNETSERVGERTLGGFGGWLNGSDWATRMGIMHCCTGNATRTLYYIWEHMVTWSEDVLRVNLLLNHATHRADVYSYSPYEGRLDLKIKSKCGKILNHAPEWVEQDSDALSVCVNGKERAHAWEGRYVCVGSGNPDDTVVMTYPMTGYMIKEQLGDGIYTLTLKGNTVIDINPPGRHCPLYQRAHYREERVRWRKIQRFVAEEGLRW